jgi:cyclin-dependent kinase 2
MMQDNLRRYQKLELLGEGTYGKVFKAVDTITGHIVAIKKTLLDLEEGVPSSTLREIYMLKALTHDHIVTLLDIARGKKRLYLIFEFLDCDLRSYLNTRVLTDLEVKNFMYQLISTLAFCHSRHVIHRDLKPHNLLVTHGRTLKIADFGLARTYSIPSRPYSLNVQTLWYRAPEVLLGCENYGPEVDVWSVGCILVEVITGKPLFQGRSKIDQLWQIFNVLGTPDEKTWPGVTGIRYYRKEPKWDPIPLDLALPGIDALAIDLIEKMLKINPESRISCLDALNHAYFQDFSMLDSLNTKSADSI